MKNLILLSFIVVFASTTIAQTITINFTNIRNNKGQFCLGVYTNQKDYANKVAVKKQKVMKATMKDGKLTAKIEGLAPGTYGIALLDDEDFDRKMAYGFLLPKEGFAFSDYYHKGMSKPSFEDFDFVLGKEDKTIEMKIRYL